MEGSEFNVRYNIMDIPSLDAFINIRGGMNNNCKDVYFIRAVGVNETYLKDIEKMDKILSERMFAGQCQYSRIAGLPRLASVEDVNAYSECYDKWERSGRTLVELSMNQQCEALKRVMGTACSTIIDIYNRKALNVNPTMERNFCTKLMFWSDKAVSELFRGWNGKNAMKAVFTDISKEQEYLFCCFLTMLGIDVLLLQNKTDISEALEQFHLSKKIILGERKECNIPAFDASIYEKRTEKATSIPEKHQQASINASVSGQKEQVPVEQGIVSEEKEQALARAGTVPGQKESVSVEQGTVPGQKESVPVEQGTVPGQKEQVPVEQGIVSEEKEQALVGAGTVSEQRSQAVRNAETVSKQKVQTSAETLTLQNNSSSGRPQPVSWRKPEKRTGSVAQSRREMEFEELALLAASVVMIAIHDRNGQIIGTGSGIMIGKGGFILTNNHVASGGAFYSVRIEDDETIYETDEVIKYNQVLDLAVIRIQRTLQPIPIYNGKKELVRGQKVVAIGSPLGLFNSVSDGIISGFRKINDVDMIQFTAPTSHGSSGGAVLNMYGEVIGISTAGIDNGQNINLAVGYECINHFVRGFT